MNFVLFVDLLMYKYADCQWCLRLFVSVFLVRFGISVRSGKYSYPYSPVGGKKGNRTEPTDYTSVIRLRIIPDGNYIYGNLLLYTEISDCCGIGFYLHHRTEPSNAILKLFILELCFSFYKTNYL